MSIPPFPSQDLAKLVLGYLAEEQHMTAYDEFLQASPYLDALQNEYDRIFMTSLKSILAEYRAVKIYVETCKPLLLRKKIFQCANLLDVVKLLVNHVDLNKIQSQDADKAYLEKYHSIIPNKTNTCETCASLQLVNCVCNSRLKTQAPNNQTSHLQDYSFQNSVETTPLIDLPGNHVDTTRKKQIKVLDKDSTFISDGQNTSKESLTSNVCVEENRSCQSIELKSDVSTVSLNSTVKEIDLAESRKKIEEFDNVLKSVVDKNNTVTGSENLPNQRVSNANTFQDFASGVSGVETQNPNVPDSSTCESLSIQAPKTKDCSMDNVIGPQKRQLLLQVSHRNDNFDSQTCRDNNSKYTKIKAKPDDQKVKILSDVKVTNKKKPLKNAISTALTSTPLMQMQTIVINGTPAYKHTPVTNHTFTKDEIMAMPTLIVVPASGPSRIPSNAHCQPIMTQNCNAATIASSTSRSLGPLVIDVPPTPGVVKQPEYSKTIPDLLPVSSESGLVKTVDFTKNASVPKDNEMSGATKTPQGLPPVRKSSSTPRRTTHVRVLDFATPRRILHETINEQVTSQTSESPVEIILSCSPNVSLVDTTVAENTLVNSQTDVVHSNAVVQKVDVCSTDTGSVKENTTTSKLNQFKKSNWDADLRALVAKEVCLGTSTKFKKSTKKKKTIDKSDNKKDKKNSDTNTVSSIIKKVPKKRRKVIEEDDDPPPDAAIKPDISVKPTINIISGGDRVVADSQIVQDNKDIEILQNNSNDNEDDCVETPEGDRLSLQNVIGARLNISDLLETPYKQALYDIQMGTPKFLPDLPGEPLSDIKITNIPTPRFLDTPKPVQATPSSWSSRPTDYSSGGSYYKPDDQDYMPVPDLRCIVSSSSKEDTTLDKSGDIVRDDEKKSRPQRQCTKNVSYYRFANLTNKAKEADDVIDAASTCSDSTCSIDYKNKELVVKTPKDKSKLNKSENKRRVSCKKKKSPTIKEKTKPFIKIKPRQTPTKLTPSRYRKKNETPGYKSPNKFRRNRTSSRDKNEDTSLPLVVAAPTRSRRKSSTPRKLHCTKSFNSENSNHTSPETIDNTKQNVAHVTVPHTQDSDAEQIALRWSDDGSQDAKSKEHTIISLANEGEDIYQIQKYIQTTGSNQPRSEGEDSFRASLVQRGFDVETAKKLERDLLDIPAPGSDIIDSEPPLLTLKMIQAKNESALERTLETDDNVTKTVQIVHDESEEEEVEFSPHSCNEKSKNYFVVQHDNTNEMSQESAIKLKDKFSMDICIDDGVTVRLRATPFSLTLDQDPIGVEAIDYSYNYKETEMAVSSISNMERLYTPLKESYKTQCYEIFDSTLTSLDTPLKDKKILDSVTTVTEIVLEEEQIQKDKAESMKRKRSSGSEESISDTKKTKYLLTSASIQNIDIESVLTKLHGP